MTVRANTISMASWDPDLDQSLCCLLSPSEVEYTWFSIDASGPFRACSKRLLNGRSDH